MNDLKEIFSNRELATFVWIAIFIVLFSFKKEIRKSILQVIKSFFVTGILSIILLLAIYTLGSILILKYYRFWDLTLIKDTIFWFVGFAFMTLFKLDKAKEISFFLNVLKDSFNAEVKTSNKMQHDAKNILHLALDRLNETQRSLVMLKDYEGYNYIEIGKITGLNESQVKVYLHRARLQLREFIGKPENII